MPFDVAGITYQNAQECLKDLLMMVRTGISNIGLAPDLNQKIKATISRLKKDAAANRSAWSESDLLRLQTEEAEYLFQNGRCPAAIGILKPLWERYRPDLSQLVPTAPVSHDARVLIEQKLWAMLHYVFADLYFAQLKHQEALKEFGAIEKTLVRLRQKNYRAGSTFAALYYFVGHAYRAQRNFEASERNFLLAQTEILERVRRRLKRDMPPSDQQYEIAYHNVFTSRVLGAGLGWVALHEGNLGRAVHLLTTAGSLLSCTSYDSLQIFMRANLHTASRRKAAFDSEEYTNSLGGLKECFTELQALGDENVMRRCARELSRAYLDLVEFGNQRHRAFNMTEAKSWLGELAKARPDDIPYRLLMARFYILQGNLPLAEDEYSLACSIASSDPDRQSKYTVDLTNMKALLLIKSGFPDQVPKLVNEQLDRLHGKPSKSAASPRQSDPVLEAESYLLLAEAAARRGLFEDGRRCLAKWKPISHFVENRYLHHLGTTISRATKNGPFHVEFDFNIKEMTNDQRINAYQEYIFDSMRKRHPSEENQFFEDFFDRDRKTINRWRKEGKLPPHPPRDSDKD